MTMTLERFKALAESHGGDLARWPESEREAARALLISTSGALDAVLVEAAQLDRLLDLAPAQAVDSALLGRLIAAAPQPLRLARLWLAGAGAALGLGAAAMAGVAVGISIGQANPPRAPQEEALIAADLATDLSDALEEPAAL